MLDLKNLNVFIVRQQKEWGEILTGFESKNKYKVFDSNGQELCFAFEEKSNWFLRQLLKGARPFTLIITDNNKNKVLEMRRPFRWIFQEASIYKADGSPLAVIKKEYSILRKKYNVSAPDHSLIFKIFGPFFKPWTFNILENDRETGKITKKWSGTMKEMFSSADNFGAEFPVVWSDDKKLITLGAVFLIDFIHFERKG
jgi:uncharacterized protein YxjI